MLCSSISLSIRMHYSVTSLNMLTPVDYHRRHFAHTIICFVHICSYQTDELQLGSRQQIKVDNWEKDERITLRAAVKTFNRRSYQVAVCKCKSGCCSRRCRCFKKNIKCTSFCHKGQTCKNTLDSELYMYVCIFIVISWADQWIQQYYTYMP